MRALDAALGTPWAMQPHALERLLTIAARQHEVTPEALEKYRAASVDRAETMERRGSVAILNVVGPLFRRANLFTEFSGATSYDVLRRDLQVALDDRDLTAILLNVDSPGGEAWGCGELAKAIFDASKPVVAYVGGMAASGGYWLASAAAEVVMDDSAWVGSIGAIVGLVDDSEADRARGIRRFQFISSQSPLKNADPATKGGASEYQRVADDTAAVFIEAVARHRGTDVETVVADFGRGGEVVGANAVAVGMADRIGTFEDTLARLARGERPARVPTMRTRRQAAPEKIAASAASPAAPAAPTSQQETLMADQNPAGQPPVELAAAQAAATAAERARITGILGLPEAKGREALAQHICASTDMSVDAAKAMLAAAPAAQATAPEPKPDPKAEVAAYEASRIAGVGLGGETKPKAGTVGGPDRLVNGMKAMLAKGVN